MGVACLNNLRQVSLAGVMYIADYQDYLVPNNPYMIGDAAEPFLPTWAGYSVRYDVPSSTNDTMLVGGDPAQPHVGLLGPYVKSARMFRCPADRSTSLLGGTRHPRNRSYSMNGFIGTRYVSSGLGSIGVIPDVLTVAGLNALNRPEIITWIDMHEDYIESCIFNVGDSSSIQRMSSLPSARHYGRSVVAFFDARVELHKWENQSTIAPVTGSFNPLGVDTGRTRDWLWMRERMTRAKTDTW